MSNQTPHGWLESLKEGDEVAIPTYNRWGQPYEIWKVKRFTTTQIVIARVAAELRVNRETGRPMGRSGSGHCYRAIEPVTQKMRDMNERVDLVLTLSSLKTDRLQHVPLANLRQAYLLLSVEEVKS